MQERKRLDVTVVYLHQAFISFVVLYKRGFVMFGVVSLTMGNSLKLSELVNVITLLLGYGNTSVDGSK